MKTWIVSLCCLFINLTASLTAYISSSEVSVLPCKPADHRIHYGEDPLQFGDLRLPHEPGPHPVAIVIHGGGWLSHYGTKFCSVALCEKSRGEVITDSQPSLKYHPWLPSAVVVADSKHERLIGHKANKRDFAFFYSILDSAVDLMAMGTVSKRAILTHRIDLVKILL